MTLAELTWAILTDAADLVRRGWTQGEFATADDGTERDPRDPEAVRWSLIGAVRHAAWRRGVPTTASIRALRSVIGISTDDFPGQEAALVRWNDDPDRTQGEVVAALERAAGQLPSCTPSDGSTRV